MLGQRNRTRSTTPIASIVITARDARRDCRLDEFACGLERWRARGDPKRAGRIVRRHIDRDVAAGRQSLAFAEIGQHLGIAPPGGAACGPRVKVARMAAHIHHVVEAGRAAEHLAARHRDAPPIEPETGFPGVGGVHPVPTRHDGSSERRDAITAPAEPPPTTMKSKFPDMSPFSFSARRQLPINPF
jgi:hypothetical protein